MRIPRQHVSKGLRAFSPFWAGSPASYQCAHEQGLAQGSNLGLEHRADGVHSGHGKQKPTNAFQEVHRTGSGTP